MVGLLDGQWVTEGGLETDLIFNHGVELPEFAAFPLLDDPDGIALLKRYYADFATIAHASGAGLLLETPTWRANPDWGRALGYDKAALDRVNRAGVALIRDVLAAADIPDGRVSGCVGPRGDGYIASGADADEAAEHHEPQIRSLADAGADLVHAMTMTEPAEAVGVVRAARSAGVAVSVSFTVETNGLLPDGSTIADALQAVDAAAPADFYGLNCAHPTHVLAALDDGPWREKLTFFRPNASTLSHADLDVMEELDAGDLSLLVSSTRELLARLPAIAVLGGCCGTDRRHVAALWQSATSRP
ncbi:homocysteine S-methyltransferase family protein [Dactylosporangium sp. CS-047395]|uniref:homocysteine S-methyltransferase family protein n=1 Tax=Dactylosporangium sp. CS-047395 TaxID=3239936 RepID=UPI003D917C21